MTDRERRNDRQRPLPDDIVRGRDGKPLVDRYGRPVRRRPAPPRQEEPRRTPQRRPRRQEPRQEPTWSERPRVEPPRSAPPRADQTRYDMTRQAPVGRPGERPGERPRQYVPPRQPAPERRPMPPQHQQPVEVPRRISRRTAAGAAGHSGGGRRFRAPGCLGAFGWVVAVLLVLTLAVTLWADAQLNRVESTPSQQVANTPGTNWLLVGSDSRQGLTDEDVDRLGTGGDIGVGRTDTIMLLHIPTGGQARLVSLPRDSYVTIPGYGEDKINAAFTYGGPTLLTATVEQATGLHIDHYAEIGMGGLANVVDSVGGVELCPDYPIDDPLANLSVQAGCQEMDGPTALGYVRTRATPMGDLDRVDRQREFFAALIDTMTNASTLLNPVRIVPLVTSTARSFTVGDGDHVWHLARVALAMRSGVETETVPVAGFADYAVGNVVLWDEAGAQALWDSMK